MTYKISYLSNGNKVKITKELFYQLKKWEMDGVILSPIFTDELKSQDNAWINSNRRHYAHKSSTPLDQVISDRGNALPLSDIVIQREALSKISDILNTCSSVQRRRFLKHFYYGFTYEEIAQQEQVNKSTIRQSVKKVLESIESMNIL